MFKPYKLFIIKNLTNSNLWHILNHHQRQHPLYPDWLTSYLSSTKEIATWIGIEYIFVNP